MGLTYSYRDGERTCPLDLDGDDGGEELFSEKKTNP